MTQTPIAQLKFYPGNARRGDIDLIAESLERLGQYKPVVACVGEKAPGLKNTLLAGNHTVMAAQRLGWDTIDVHWVDVDADTAKRVVIVDNKANDEATYEVEDLVNLLTELPDLAGTGFDRDELDELLEALDAPELEEETPPEETAAEGYDLLVECADAEERARVKKQLLAQGVVVSNV